MKYLRSLMQQFVTACKNQAKLIQQFTLSLLYLFIIHIVALLFFFLFRLVLFTSIDYQFPPVYLANLHTSFLCNLIYPTFSKILLYSC